MQTTKPEPRNGDRYRTANDSERVKGATFEEFSRPFAPNVESLSRSLLLAVL